MNRVKAAVLATDWRKLFHRTWPVLALAFMLFLILNQHHAHAADAAQNNSQCKDYPGLTNRIAACIRLTMQDIAYTYFDGFYQIVKDAISAFVVLAVVIYGVLVAAGMIEKFGRDMVVLAIKISMVFYFTTNVQQLYDWDITIMDAAGSAVVSFVPQSGTPDGVTDASRIVCMQNMINQAAKPTTGDPVVGPWLAMDCLIDTVIGIKVPVDNQGGNPPGAKKWWNDNLSDQDRGLSRGMLAFFFSSAQTSVMGMLIAIIGFIFLYSLVFLIVKSLFTYLGGYIGITFLMILAPMFIPLVLFRQTKEYFDKWLKMIISFTLQPVVMLIFIVMTIIAVDLVMFSGDYSVMYKIAGDASRQHPFSLNKYLEDHQISFKKDATLAQVKANRDNSNVTADSDHPNGILGLMATSTCKNDSNQNGQQQQQQADDPNCRHYSMKWWHDALDWQKLADARTPAVQIEGSAKTTGEEISREVLAAILFAGIVVFIMNGLLVVVPMIANDLVADFGVSPNLYARMSPLPMQQQASEAVRNFVGRMGSNIGGRSGGQQ